MLTLLFCIITIIMFVHKSNTNDGGQSTANHVVSLKVCKMGCNFLFLNCPLS